MTFYEAFPRLIQFEGGYVNHPNDTETKYGITIATARSNGYIGDMQDLTLARAMEIAKKEYWDVIKCDSLPDLIQFPMFDAAYNSGPVTAVIWLQKIIRTTQDGVVGPITIQLAKDFSPLDLKIKLLAERLKFMTSLSTWDKFGKGWARRIADIMET
jgi:lysozyme family protein